LIYRLSISEHSNKFVLKGGMLVTLWTSNSGRFTRDVYFLGLGKGDEAELKNMFGELLAIDADDGLIFDATNLNAAAIREDHIYGGNLGRFVQIRPNHLRQLKSKAAEREVPLHPLLEQLLDQRLPTSCRLFPSLTVDRVVKRYAYLRTVHRELHGTVFHSTRKWFITQCERTGVPEHFTASLVGHQSARSENKLTYGLYSAGISDTQKREIVDQIRLPVGVEL
jgi:hypothetical protein